MVPLIEGGQVFINGKLVTSPSASLKEDDLVTVRHMGKFRYVGVYPVKKPDGERRRPVADELVSGLAVQLYRSDLKPRAAKAGYRGASRMRKPSKVLLQGLQRHRAFGEHRGKPSLHPAAYRDFRAGWPSAGFDKLL